MDKENISGILFSLKHKKKEILPFLKTWMNLEDIMLSEISQSQEKSTAWFHFCEVSKIVRLIEAENRLVVAKGWGWGGGNRELLLSGYKISVMQDE